MCMVLSSPPTLRPSQSIWAVSSPKIGSYHPRPPSPLLLLLARRLILIFYRPTKGGRLSRPKHCSKGAQPVLKTVYHSSCRDKHNCQGRDSNLGSLTPQSDALTTWLLRPETHFPSLMWAASFLVTGLVLNYMRMPLLPINHSSWKKLQKDQLNCS